MYKTQNGWTKDDMIAHVLCEYTGISMSEDLYQCNYRGRDGRKCAVGIFIPNDKYTTVMEVNSHNTNNGADFVIDKYNLTDDMPLDKAAMKLFQSVHDDFGYDYGSIDADEDCLVALVDWIEDNVES